MSREVRRVPANWEHPKDANGHFIPMHERFPYSREEVSQGIKEGWLDRNKGKYLGIQVMPNWKKRERTHYQMYEDTTEGTPISPVCESPEKLARWLADNGASAFGDRKASYDAWLRVVNGQWRLPLSFQGIN